MTIIGVAAIDTSALQSQMTRNSLYARNLYQKSLSEIEAQFKKTNDLEFMTEIMTGEDIASLDNDAGIEVLESDLETYDPNDPYSQSLTFTYVGEGPPLSGYSLGLYVGRNFEIDSISIVDGTGSESDQTQGLNYPAPASD